MSSIHAVEDISPAQSRYRSQKVPLFASVPAAEPVTPEAVAELRATLDDFARSGEHSHLFTAYLHKMTEMDECVDEDPTTLARSKSFVRVLSELGRQDPTYLHQMMRDVNAEYAVNSICHGTDNASEVRGKSDLRWDFYIGLATVPFDIEQKKEIIKNHLFSNGKWAYAPEMCLTALWLDDMSEGERNALLETQAGITIGYDAKLRSARFNVLPRDIMSIGDHLAASGKSVDWPDAPNWYHELLAAKGDKVGYPREVTSAPSAPGTIPA